MIESDARRARIDGSMNQEGLRRAPPLLLCNNLL